jgi:hypothetical protein
MILAFLALTSALTGAPPAAADTTLPAQGVEYRIEARVDEQTDILHGRASLRYTNRSTSTLDTLWFHQHLNAFRPNSAFARRELEFGIRRFQDIAPEDQAFSRFTSVEAGGRALHPVYPGSPDSTVVGIPLPAPLRPGQSVTLRMDWDARLATIPRRQGRRGSEYNWAHWYPRIAVFEKGRWQTQPLLPQGEFYGEFASYDVTLDVPASQVIGATGVPVEGDPGWAGAAAPGTGAVEYARDAYPASAAEPLGLLGAETAGRRRVRWRAEQVHHFAWSSSPDYIYEQGKWRDVPIHVLFNPAQAADWGGGVVVGRAAVALEWLDSIFGTYRYPQFTVLPRIEAPGATEFEMLIMNGGFSQGLILHETAHQFAHGMLANNEWREGWLDEGMADFVTDWYWEAHGRPDAWLAGLDTIEVRDRHGDSEPVGLSSADFANPRMYNFMTYTKGALVLRMLRELVGADTMRAVLHEYFRRNAMHHVSEADLRAAVNDVTGSNYDWFFEQWIHTTKTLDYGLGEVSLRRSADGRWETWVEVVREGEAWMPVELRVGSETRLLDSRDSRQVVKVTTAQRPTEVVLDPERVLIDTRPENNRRALAR